MTEDEMVGWHHQLSEHTFYLFIYYFFFSFIFISWRLMLCYFTTFQWVLSYIDMSQPWSYM